MVADLVVTTQQEEGPSTTIERPNLHRGQIENQDQIKEKDVLVIHFPNDLTKRITIVRGPFKCGGSLCIDVLYMGGPVETISLADLSVVRYRNRTWNIGNWLGKF